MRRAIVTGAVSTLLLACGGAEPPPEACGEVAIVDLSIRGPAGGVAVADGKATVPLTVSATIPCIRGGARAAVTSSSGKLDDQPLAATVTLAPISATSSTALAGYSTLVLDPVRDTRVNVQIGSATACRLFVVSLEGTTPVHVDEGDCTAP